MEPLRPITEKEWQALDYLVKQAGFTVPDVWRQTLLIQKIDDGGMGSFRIFENGDHTNRNRQFGKQVGEFEFVDDDGILVLVTLNLDDEGKLFEVDVWKMDFNPVINFKVPV